MSANDEASKPTLPSYSLHDELPQLTSKASSHSGSHTLDPVVQVRETIITTTTTIFSPRNPSSPSPANIPRASSPLASVSDRDLAVSPSGSSIQSNVTLDATTRPQFDKELPQLPADILSEAYPAPSQSTTSIGVPVSLPDQSFSTASLARAALRLGSPPLGLSFERSFPKASTPDGPETPASSSIFTISSSPGQSPIPGESSSYDEHGVFFRPLPDSADRSRSLSLASETRSRKVTFKAGSSQAPFEDVPNVETLAARPRAQGISRGLFRSRSMYGRGADDTQSGQASDRTRPVLELPSRSSTVNLVDSPTEVLGTPDDSLSSKRFWKSPLRAVATKSARRPTTSDGVPRNSPAPSNSTPGVKLVPSPTTEPASPIPLLSVATPIPPTKPNLSIPRAPSVRRIASTPKLLAVDDKPARRRSMSLFQRARPLETSTEPASASLALIPGTTTPSNLSKPSPLLRKLSQSLLNPSPRSSPASTSTVPQRASEDAASQQQADVIRSLSAEFAGSGKGPEAYVRRMMHSVNPAEVAGILAASKESFHTKALKSYMQYFDFRAIPLDIALRRLLLEVRLPQETQQIDRVIGAFAARYDDCNPGLFSAPDTAYILSYSLVLLHSDAFNKANKVKMQKDAYVRNTRLPGVLPCVLEYFYDNITAQPFKRASEHPEDIESVISESYAVYSNDSILPTPSSIRHKRPDIYYIITHNLLHTLRIDMPQRVPPTSPFRARFELSFNEILGLFDNGLDARHKGSIKRKSNFLLAPSSDEDLSVYDTFRIIKAGVLRRRDDLLLGNQRTTSRKSKSMAVLLTPSQLLFFRSLSIITFIEQHKLSEHRDLAMEFSVEPDDVVSLQNAFTVQEDGLDETTIRFVSPSKHQYLLEADNPQDAALWMSLLNYASAFRTSGLQMRTRKVESDLRMDDTAAEASHAKPRFSRENTQTSSRPEGVQRVSPSLHPRSAVTTAKLREIGIHLDRGRAALQSEMRQVRNLAILTPLQKSTRDRIEGDLDPVARRVKQLRLQITRLECEHEVLQADLIAFETGSSGVLFAGTSSRDISDHLDVATSEAPGHRPDSSSGSYYSAVDDT